MSTARYFLLCWAVALATHWSGLYEPMHADWSTRLRVARDWRGGAALYRETYCNTQPVVYLWILLIDSARPEMSAYLVEATLVGVAASFLRGALRREVPRAASVAPLLLIAWSGTSTTFYGGQITEAPALWCDVLAISCFALSVRKCSPHAPREEAPALPVGYLTRSVRTTLAILAGVFVFLTVGFRIPAAVNCLAWIPLMWRTARREGFAHAAWLLAAAIGGAAGSLLLLYLHGVWNGYWPEFLIVLQRNLSYGAVDRVPLSASLFEATRTIGRILLHNTAAPVLLAGSFAILFATADRLPKRTRQWLAIGLLWLLAALASGFPGGRHYDHYYHLCWAPMSLLACLWLDSIGRRPRVDADRKARPVMTFAWGITAGVILVAVLSNVYGAAKSHRDRQAGTHPAVAIARAVEYLNQSTSPQTPVVMNLWGDCAELYWRAPRPAPSLPIPHVVPRDRYGQWVDDTITATPKLIVTDGTPWSPIDGPADPQDLQRLLRLIADDYEEVQRIGDMMFLARKGDGAR